MKTFKHFLAAWAVKFALTFTITLLVGTTVFYFTLTTLTALLLAI